MTRYRLNKDQLVAWNKTLMMWQFIAEEYRGEPIIQLKKRWSWAHPEMPFDSDTDCYLCDCADIYGGCNDKNQYCPMRKLLDRPGGFDCMGGDDSFIDFIFDPVGFYSFLWAMDQKAKEMGLIPSGDEP